VSSFPARSVEMEVYRPGVPVAPMHGVPVRSRQAPRVTKPFLAHSVDRGSESNRSARSRDVAVACRLPFDRRPGFAGCRQIPGNCNSEASRVPHSVSQSIDPASVKADESQRPLASATLRNLEGSPGRRRQSRQRANTKTPPGGPGEVLEFFHELWLAPAIPETEAKSDARSLVIIIGARS